MTTLRWKLILLSCLAIMLQIAVAGASAQTTGDNPKKHGRSLSLEEVKTTISASYWITDFAVLKFELDESKVHGVVRYDDGREARIDGRIRNDQRLHVVWWIGQEEMGEVVLTMRQDEEWLSGTWSAWFDSGTTNGGTLDGTVSSDGDTAEFLLNPSVVTDCAISATVAIHGDEAVGNYATVDCYVLLTGTIHVIRSSEPGPDYNPQPPAAPVEVTVTAGDWQIILEWPPVGWAADYTVYYVWVQITP